MNNWFGRLIMIEKLIRHCEDFLPAIQGLRRFESGGQKVVLLGTHIIYGNVVLKLIEISTESSGQRALREMEIASKLKGDHFACVYEFGSFTFENEYMYIIEEYIEGLNLRKHLSKVGKMDIQQVLKLGCNLLEALQTIHSENLVHRDLKPENIILSSDKVVVIDFGIARDLAKQSLTADLAFFGPMTIGYAAPEQIKNQKKQICNRTDLFSWGIIMYECLSGINPFTINSKKSEIVLKDTLTFTPPLLLCENQEFLHLVHACLNKAIHRRPPSAGHILEIIQ